MTTTQILTTLAILAILVIIGLLIALSKQKRAHKELLEDIRPYHHWAKLTDCAYAIPLSCHLFDEDSNCIGTVFDHFKDFSEESLPQLLDNYYYGKIAARTCIECKIVTANAYSKYVCIAAPITNKQFWVERSKEDYFPKSVKIKFEDLTS